MKKQKHSQGSNQSLSTPKSKPIQMLLVTIAGAGIAASSMFAFYKLMKVDTTMDKTFVLLFWFSMIVYASYDIKDKLEKWRLK